MYQLSPTSIPFRLLQRSRIRACLNEYMTKLCTVTTRSKLTRNYLSIVKKRLISGCSYPAWVRRVTSLRTTRFAEHTYLKRVI